MKRLLHRLASTRLTVGGFVLLGAAVLASLFTPAPVGWAVVLPLSGLALNLAAALATRPALRRGGLGLFHGALLVCLGLVAWGRLTHFEGRVEIAQGSHFEAAAVLPLSQGPWHRSGLAALQLDQGPISVHYAPGVKRALTRSQVWVADGDRRVPREVREDQPLKLAGYRFTTTHNKGFAPLITWQAPSAAPLTGALHLPAYPLMEWQQQQRWQAPGGPELRLWLRLAQPVNEHEAWRLQPDRTPATLVVEMAGQRFELQPGDTARSAHGTLRYERLLGWMGYRVHHDETLGPLALMASLGTLGLAWHLWPPRGAPRRALGRALGRAAAGPAAAPRTEAA